MKSRHQLRLFSLDSHSLPGQRESYRPEAKLGHLQRAQANRDDMIHHAGEGLP